MVLTYKGETTSEPEEAVKGVAPATPTATTSEKQMDVVGVPSPFFSGILLSTKTAGNPGK